MKKKFLQLKLLVEIAAVLGLCIGALAQYQYMHSAGFQHFLDDTFHWVPSQGVYQVGPVTSKKITFFKLNLKSVTPFIASWNPPAEYSAKDATGDYGSLPAEGTFLVIVKPAGADMLIGQYPTLDTALAGWLDKSTSKEERFAAMQREQD